MTSQPHPNPATRVCSKKALSRKEGAKKLATGMLESFLLQVVSLNDKLL